MGKRYKRGNVGRKRRVKSLAVYKRREKEINDLIKLFYTKYYTYSKAYLLNDRDCYNEMYQLKSEIKRNLYYQENILHKQSFYRRNIYYHQVQRFKRIYTKWKNDTRYTFLTYKCRVPDHILSKVL